MTRVLVWKEVREQGAVLTALIVLGAAVLVAAAVLLDTADTGTGRATELRSLTAAGRLGLLMLTMTAGMVVGGTLFAGEREAGTFGFLDGLPGSRWAVWWRKTAAGAGMVAVAVAVFLAVAIGGRLIDSRAGLTGWVLLGCVVAYAAYGWGIFGSVLARTSLAACGIGLGVGTLAGCVTFVVLGVGMNAARHEINLRRLVGPEQSVWELASLAAGYTLMAIPVPIAAWLYTAPDRGRRLAALNVRLPGVGGVVRMGLGGLPRARWGAGVRRLVWLVRRQTVPTALAVGGAALVAGCALIPAEGVASVIWPVLTLLAGVLAGVVTLADEQGGQAFRFWGERRLPVGRVWAAKVVTGLGLTLLTLILLLVPAAVALAFGSEHHRGGSHGPLVSRLFRSGLFAEPGFPILTYLLVWPAYGFAFGHLAGLLFRKAVVAAAVAVMTGGTLAAFWLPSLLAGGVHPWQVFVPPVIALLTARLLTWPWATDRLGTRRPLARLTVGGVAVLAAIAAGLVDRVAEVPLVPEVEEDVAFAGSLPSYDDKQAGRDLRRALGQLGEVDPSVRGARPEKPLTKSMAYQYSAPGGYTPTYLDQLTGVLEQGWPADRPDLDRWMNRMFAPGWEAHLEEMAKKPAGVLEDPNDLAIDSQLRYVDGVRQMTVLYLARALKRQADGEPAAFPHSMSVWLAAVRTTRNNTLAVSVLVSRAMEYLVYQALDRWLERLDGRPDLLRAALAAVQEHDRQDPFDPQAVRLAEQVVVRNSVTAPSRWLPRYLDGVGPGGDRSGLASPQSETEANVVAFGWAVPWEKERLRRVVGLGNRPGRARQVAEYLRGAPGVGLFAEFDQTSRPQFLDGHKQVLAARRAAALKLAARLYEADAGRLPAKLGELVPRYLPAVPADPFDGRPFRYRVSAGETVTLTRMSGALPDLPPGLEVGLNENQYAALAALGGGLVCWPLTPGWDPRQQGSAGPSMPGLPSPAETTASAGAVGGVAFRQQAPVQDFHPAIEVGIPDPAAPGGPGGPGEPPAMPAPWAERWLLQRSNPFAPDHTETSVPPGQGILWSVGQDGFDNGGVSDSNDLIYLIPRPAGRASERAKEKP